MSAPTAGSLRWWALLLLLSALLGGALNAMHFPAGVLLGCMVAGIVLSSHEVRLEVPPTLFVWAQGVLGCLMARSLQPSVLMQLGGDWPLFLGATLSVMAASAALGWVLMQRQVFPGTTAIWGLAPGAASAMVLMSEDYGADVRLVAFMQYLRVVMVTAVASLVARLWASGSAAPASALPWLALVDLQALGWTLLLALGASTLARRLRISGGPMLVPLVLAMLLQGGDWLHLELPQPLLALSYAVLGWSIGLRFNRAILLHAWRALPKVLAAIVALMGVGVGLALLLTQWAGFAPLTAYL
ncbi:MAG: AbrB family transcriptional regulator, partial [Rhodoferax sp.]